jgi:hypothetical protein
VKPASLAASLPAGEANGLAAIADQLVEHPAVPRVVVAIVDVRSVRTDVDDGTRSATVRVRRVEVITNTDDQDQLRRLLMREFERRTGQAVLPFELEADVRRAFDHTDDHGDTP